MDKLDKIISQSKKNTQPSKNFVDNVMQAINPNRATSRRFFSLTRLAFMTSALAVIALLIFTGYKLNEPSSPSSSGSPTIAQNSSTNDATLTSDLGTISNNLTSENQQLTASNNSINDQAQEIVVPTN